MPTDTGGWDTASAVRYSELDAMIKRDNKYPTNFSKSITSNITQTVQAITGTFASWSLSDDASGLQVGFSATVGSGTFTVTPQSATPTTVDLAGAILQFSVALKFFDDPANTNRKILKPSDATGAVTCMGVTVQGPPPQQSELDIIQNLFDAWGKETLAADFDQEFVSVEELLFDATSNNAWLNPTDYAFAVVPATPDTSIVDVAKRREKFLNDSILGVMTMTESRPPPATVNLTNTIVPENSNSGFLISYERYATKMLMPNIHLLFPNSTAANFETRSSGTEIVNMVELQVEDLTLENGSKVSPKIPKNGFVLELTPSYLNVRFDDLHFSWGPFNATVNVKANTSSTLALSDKGGPLLSVDTGYGDGTVVSDPNWDYALIGIDIFTAVLAMFTGVGGLIASSAEKALQAGANTAQAAIPAIEMANVVPTAAGAVGDGFEAAGAVVAVANGAYAVSPITSFFARSGLKIAAVSVAGVTVVSSAIIISKVLKGIDDENFNKVFIKDLVDTVTSPVSWPLGNVSTVNSMGFNGALQFGANLA
jgi:hypothetical protein